MKTPYIPEAWTADDDTIPGLLVEAIKTGTAEALTAQWAVSEAIRSARYAWIDHEKSTDMQSPVFSIGSTYWDEVADIDTDAIINEIDETIEVIEEQTGKDGIIDRAKTKAIAGKMYAKLMRNTLATGLILETDTVDTFEHNEALQLAVDNAVTDKPTIERANEIIELAGRYENDGEELQAILIGYDHSGHTDSMTDWVDDSYRGCWDSFLAYVTDFADECILSGYKDNSHAARYFDYEKLAADMEYEHTTIEINGKSYVFMDC